MARKRREDLFYFIPQVEGRGVVVVIRTRPTQMQPFYFEAASRREGRELALAKIRHPFASQDALLKKIRRKRQ